MHSPAFVDGYVVLGVPRNEAVGHCGPKSWFELLLQLCKKAVISPRGDKAVICNL